MRILVLGLALLLGGIGVVAGQNDSPPNGQGQTMNGQVRRQIESDLRAEPTLRDSSVGVRADDQRVTLEGLVQNEAQHNLAIFIAQSYAGNRSIVDKIRVQGQGSDQRETGKTPRQP